MSSPSTTRMRRPIIAVLAAALLCPAIAARADTGGPLYIPLGLSRAGPWATVPVAPTPPPVDWSRVLQRMPLYPGARLEFFEVRPAAEPPEAAALYATNPGEEGSVRDWYREVLAAYGWRLMKDDASGLEWRHHDGWLAVAFVHTVDGAVRLQLSRNIEAATRPEGEALVGQLPVPAGAVRRRYDRIDLLPEALELREGESEARESLKRALEAAGWGILEEVRFGDSAFMRLERGGEVAVASILEIADEAVQLGLGDEVCWPADDDEPTGGFWSVYMDGAPAPPQMSIEGFERDTGGRLAVERWSASCHDLDMLAGLYLRALDVAAWQPASARGAITAFRAPGRLGIEAAPASGLAPMQITARMMGGGAVVASLERQADGIRRTEQVSLLFDDLPMPPGSEPLRMERDTLDGWEYRETYAVSGPPAGDLAGWCRPSMEAADWSYERLEPPEAGRAQVYHSGGEEVLCSFGADAEPRIEMSRRRVCESEQPLSVPDEGVSARHLDEMSIYPGARFLSFDAPEERYRVRCAGLGVMTDWYRSAMERGDWSLAAVEGPEDPLRRRLLFVRPDEIEWPPDARSAWAEVELVREWPYQYLVLLRRDPAGMRPGAGP